jgi:hypothetical protein
MIIGALGGGEKGEKDLCRCAPCERPALLEHPSHIIRIEKYISYTLIPPPPRAAKSDGERAEGGLHGGGFAFQNEKKKRKEKKRKERKMRLRFSRMSIRTIYVCGFQHGKEPPLPELKINATFTRTNVPCIRQQTSREL